MTPVDFSNQEVISFFKKMNEKDVKFLLVGGFAMAFYGYIRATVDFDLWVKDETSNPIGTSGFVIDPMKNLKAFTSYDFDACYSRSEAGEINGIKFRVIAAKDLLKEKKSTNRAKDQGDIEFLENNLD